MNLKHLTLAPLAWASLSLLSANAQDFNAVSQGIDQKLEQSLVTLADVRSVIAEEKIPLSKEVNALESEVVTLRSEKNALLKTRDNRTVDLNSLERQVGQMNDQVDFIGNQLNQFINEFEGRLHISEFADYEELVRDAKLAPQNENLSPQEKRELQFSVIDTAMERIENLVGGSIYDGKALSPKGVLMDGTFAYIGPSVYFASSDGAVYGLVENQLNAADPVVVELPDRVASRIPQTLDQGEGALPFDAQLGKALKVVKAKKSLMAYVEDGGEVGYVIIGLGVIGILLALFKCFEILGFKVAQPKDIDAILNSIENGDPQAAKTRAQSIGGAAGEMLAVGVEHSGEKRGILEEMMFERILKARPNLERFLPFLAITAAAAPLLGLLGTVIGMIKTSQLITIFGTGDAKSLSSGISEALVTTALGLIVAIPTLILHGMLSRMAKRKLGLLEQGAVGFVNGVMATRHQEEHPASAPAKSSENDQAEATD